jgi:putative transposase
VAGRRWGDGQGPFWRDLVGPNPTDRGKKGVKRSLLVEADGGPLSVVLAGANVRDDKLLLLEATLEAIVVERPRPAEEALQHLCLLDKGYDNRPSRELLVEERGYVPHVVRRIGEEKLDEAGEKRYPARRWVVERTLGWLSRSAGRCWFARRRRPPTTWGSSRWPASSSGIVASTVCPFRDS